MASTISGLSVKVSAATTQFRAGMSRAQDAAGDLALSLQRLNLSSDRAESSLDSAGRSATTTAFQFSGLSFASSILTTRIFGLSAAMWGALIPALGVLSTALAPLVAALGGFVAIAGAIGGIGLVGTIGAIATNTDRLQEGWTSMVETLKDELAPAFDLATEVLLIFMGEIEEVADELLPSEQAMSRLAGNFANLGSAVIEMLPAFSQLATELALRFLPPFVDFAQRILPQVPGMIRSLANAFDRVLPILFGFGRWFRDIAPDLMDFGMTVLRGVANGLGVVGGAIEEVLAIGADSESLTEFIRRMITSAATWLTNTGLPMIGGLAADIVGGLNTWLDEGGTKKIASFATSLMGKMATELGGVSEKDIQKVQTQLLGILGGVFDGVIKALNSDEAGSLGGQIGRIAGLSLRIFADELISYASSKAFRKDLGGLTGAIANSVGTAVASGIVSALAVDGAQEQGFWENVQQATNRDNAIPGQGPLIDPRTTRTGVQPTRNPNFNVVIEGELPEESIRSVSVDAADQRLTEEQRQTRRNSGRNPNPR